MCDPARQAASAAVLVIGDEILSGRTKDKNVGAIADRLTEIGVDLREVRIVPDVPEEIVGAINALRARYTYLFTTGGIGPTHDDITADCVAAAFGVGIDVDERARAMLLERHRSEDLNEARLRMARIPSGAELIPNPVSKAPGFHIGNVYVMAGVPQIMNAMLDAVIPTLTGGATMLSETVEAAGIPEGDFAAGLGAIAAAHGSVAIGSYPSMIRGGFSNCIVLRGRDQATISAARREVEILLAGLRR